MALVAAVPCISFSLPSCFLSTFRNVSSRNKQTGSIAVGVGLFMPIRTSRDTILRELSRFTGAIIRCGDYLKTENEKQQGYRLWLFPCLQTGRSWTGVRLIQQLNV